MHVVYEMAVSTNGSDSALRFVLVEVMEKHCAASLLVCTSSADYLGSASFSSCRKGFFLTFKFLWRPTNYCNALQGYIETSIMLQLYNATFKFRE